MTAKLAANEKYVITFYSSGFVNWTDVKQLLISQQTEDNMGFWCPTVQVELAIAPVLVAQKALEMINAKCPTGNGGADFPEIKFSDMQKENRLKYVVTRKTNKTQKHYHMHVSYTFNCLFVCLNRAFGFDGRSKMFFAPYVEQKDQIKIEKMYQFTVPTVAPLWWLDVAVNYDFLNNGAFGMFLVQTFNQPQDITDTQYVAKCIAADTCTPAVRRHINTLIISEPLKPGFNYSLLLYNDYTKHSAM